MAPQSTMFGLTTSVSLILSDEPRGKPVSSIGLGIVDPALPQSQLCSPAIHILMIVEKGSARRMQHCQHLPKNVPGG